MAEEGKGTVPPDRDGRWRHLLWIFGIWLFVYYLFGWNAPDRGVASVAYTDFVDRVRADRVEAVTFRGYEITGTYRPEESGAREGSGPEAGGGDAPGEGTVFRTVVPRMADAGLLELLEANGVAVRAESPKTPWLRTLVTALLPWLLILGFFVYLSRRFRRHAMGGQGPFGFAKSRAKRFQGSVSDKTFEDVAGLENAKRELREIVGYLTSPEKYRALGGKLPRGLLLVGPPGVGKTLMARAAAGEASVPFFSIGGSEFIEMFVGVGASRVRDMFQKAKKEAPAIVFIDELDSIGRVRGTGLGGGHDEREQTLNQILSEMDGFEGTESVVVLAATNRPDVLDPALVRPGRFDRRITLELPHKAARLAILKIHARAMPLAEDADLEAIADRTVGLSGADLRNLVNEAALLAARRDRSRVGPEDLERARDKILMGIEREDVVTGPEKRVIAFHEAGHAMMAALLPHADPLQKVTIIPRGQSLGATEQMPEEERHNLSRSYLLDRIAVMLGGRAAERLVFGDITTGAADDLKRVTRIARRMVCQWGMSDAVGPVAFQAGDPHPFLGRELAQSKDFSEFTAKTIDAEIRRIVQEREEKARRILSEHREELERIARALLEKETLTPGQVGRIMEGRAGDADH